ncbi:MAG: cytochrome c [Thermodesulfobacteriota bacterium]
MLEPSTTHRTAPRSSSRAIAAATRAALVVAVAALAWLATHAAADAPRPEASEAPATAGAQAEARELWASTCVSCHGPSGAGDGLAAVGLPAKPASFTDAAWQKRISDAEIERAIVGGGAAVGKSPLMPANPALASKPEVVAALLGLIRSFGAAAAR